MDEIWGVTGEYQGVILMDY